MRRVFISHPYKDNPAENKKKVDKICKDLLSQGYLPISPLHLFSYIESETGIRDEIIRACTDLIMVADHFYSYGNSEGCRIEREIAEEIGMEIKIIGSVANASKT